MSKKDEIIETIEQFTYGNISIEKAADEILTLLNKDNKARASRKEDFASKSVETWVSNATKKPMQ